MTVFSGFFYSIAAAYQSIILPSGIGKISQNQLPK
jgi:hypothetical protein